jgi:hypothetical protein
VGIFRHGTKIKAVRTPRIDPTPDRRGAHLEPVIETCRVDEMGFRDGHIFAQFAGPAQHVAPPGKHVVHDTGCAGAGPDEEETAVTVNLTRLVRDHQQIRGSYRAPVTTWPRVLRFLGENVELVRQMISHRLPLEQAIEGLELSRSKSASKVMIVQP